jgi:hypothetical protein
MSTVPSTKPKVISQPKPVVTKAKVVEPPVVNQAPVTSVPISVASPETIVSKSSVTDYRCYRIPELKQVYVQLLNDNLEYMINFIYTNKEKPQYSSPSIRVGLAMQMLLASQQLIPYQLSALIAKDIEDLRKDDEYTNLWQNPALKRKALGKELEFLRKHTEIDETISLNMANQTEAQLEQQQNLQDFDIHSGISTLNVSSHFPVAEDPIIASNNCAIM